VTPTDALREIFELSKKMLAAAKSYQWEELQQFELKEQALAAQIKAAPGQNQLHTNESRHLIQAILNNHEAIYSIAQPMLDDMKILLDALAAPPEK
jgi:hypothetical protein